MNTSLNGGDARMDAFTNLQGILGSAFNDVLSDAGNNVPYGGNSDEVLDGGGVTDTQVGDDDIDLASYISSSNGVVASLANATLNTDHAAGDQYLSIEDLSGSYYDDTLYGDEAPISSSGALARISPHTLMPPR